MCNHNEYGRSISCDACDLKACFADLLFTIGILVTGGAIGVSPLLAGIYGLLASFLTMALGHFIGQYCARLSTASLITKQKIKSIDEESLWSSISSRCHLIIDPSFASGSLLGILSLMSLYDVIEA